MALREGTFTRVNGSGGDNMSDGPLVKFAFEYGCNTGPKSRKLKAFYRDAGPPEQQDAWTSSEDQLVEIACRGG